MAGVLYELLLIGQSPHDELYAPWLRPGTWVLNGEPVKKMVFIEALPALGEMHLLGGAICSESFHSPIVKIRLLHHTPTPPPSTAPGHFTRTKSPSRARTSIQINPLR